MANEQNFTSKGRPWQKGQSGNPSGRASRMFTLVTDALREKLASEDPKTKKSYAERIAALLIKCATDPDPEYDKTRIMALSEIIDRCEGKPKQQLEVNDITAELRQRSDADLMYHMEHGYWPEDEAAYKRKRKAVEAASKLELEAAKPETDKTQ
jgi:hypothetical protein